MKLVFFPPPFSFVVGQTFLSGVKHRPAGGFGMVTGSSGGEGWRKGSFYFDLLCQVIAVAPHRLQHYCDVVWYLYDENDQKL